jgi:hypothetical protein
VTNGDGEVWIRDEQSKLSLYRWWSLDQQLPSQITNSNILFILKQTQMVLMGMMYGVLYNMCVQGRKKKSIYTNQKFHSVPTIETLCGAL